METDCKKSNPTKLPANTLTLVAKGRMACLQVPKKVIAPSGIIANMSEQRSFRALHGFFWPKYAIYFFEMSVLFETGELNAYVYDGGGLYRRKYVLSLIHI